MPSSERSTHTHEHFKRSHIFYTLVWSPSLLITMKVIGQQRVKTQGTAHHRLFLHELRWMGSHPRRKTENSE